MYYVRFSSLVTLALLFCGAMAPNPCTGQVPAAPTDLTVQLGPPGDLSTALFWTDNSDNEIGFEVQRSIGEGGEFQVIHLGTLNNTPTFNDIGLAEITRYNYRVRAYNNEGYSEFSNVTFATTGYSRPMQVSNLEGINLNGVASLSWVDEADNETRFEVQRAELGVSTSFEVIAVLGPNTANFMSYFDPTPLDGIVYTYRVVPWRFDVEGGAPLTVDIQTGPPVSPPSNFTARPRTRTSIELAWRGPFGRNDRVQIQRFNISTGFWETVAQPRASNRSYVDSGLVRGTYLYRMRRTTNQSVSVWLETAGQTR